MNPEKLFKSIVFVFAFAGLSCLIAGELLNILILRKAGIYIGIGVVSITVSMFFVVIVLSIFSDWRNR